MAEDRKPSLRVIWRLLKHIKPYKRKAVLLYVLLYGGLGFDLLRPVVVAWAINHVTRMVRAGVDEAQVIPLTLCYVLLYIGASLLRDLFRFRRGLIQTALVHGVISDLRCKVYEKVQRMSLEYHGNTSSGELIARSTRDIDKIRMFLATTVFMGPEIVFYMIGASIVILTWDYRLGVASLSMVIPTVILMAKFAGKIRPMFMDASDKYDEVTTVLQENIAGARVVRAFGQEKREICKFGSRAQVFMQQMINVITVWGDNVPFAMFIFRLSIPLTLFFGGVLVMKGAVSLGAIAACLLYLNNIADRMRAVGRMVDFTQQASASAEKIFKLLDEDEGIADADGAGPLARGPGHVVFDNVSLKLGEQKVLSEVSFKVGAGETVAVVGRTGCGKSSLISLLARFHDPDEGRVLIDGQDVTEVTLDSLRSQVGIVFQDTFLFSASVADNIRYGCPEASSEDIVRYAKAAGAHRFIEGLDYGYDTVIGERGVTLSGGQKQRISIARAVVSNPRLLVLDDATASVDSYTERGIHEALRRLSKEKTTFIISQRISTVQHADKIIVLDEGKIVQTGTHEGLLQTDGIYRTIYEGQSLNDRVAEDVIG
ncbi:MAG TPA: ABC transporter ATP-binding protein [bacterium]|nr:ABC transporter ATP-binding protein [bacterium]